MTWQQAFTVGWIQFAVATAVLLWGALVVVRRLREPAERARLVPLALAAALAVPWLSALAPWPVWNLGWIDRPAVALAERPPATAVPLRAPAIAEPTGRSSQIATGFPVTISADAARDDVPSSGPAKSDIAARAAWTSWSMAAAGILLAHAAAAIYFAVRWIAGRWQLARLCRAATPAGPHLEILWQSVAGRRGRKAHLLVSRRVDAPLVFGWLRPTVVVPERIASGNVPCLRYCLAHEWSHIDRGDLGAWTLARLCQYVFWYQPPFWALAHELRISQEFLADHRSATTLDDRLEYSELLLELARNRLATPVAGALNLLDQPSELGRRVRMLVEGTVLAARCRRGVAWAGVALALLVACAFSTIRLEAALADEAARADQVAKVEPKPERVHPSVAVAKEAEQRNSQPGAVPEALHYTGRVIEKGTEKPIAGVAVVVRRSDYSDARDKFVEESKHTTDAEGKFSFTIPPEQVAIPRLYIELDVEHPDYAAKKGFGYALSMIRKNETLGDPPFFTETKLSPADPATGTVLAPDGRPLAGVKIQGFSRARLNDFNDSSFVDTVTDAQGKFRLPLVKEGLAVMWVIPKDFAIVQRYLGKERGELGDFKLEPGVRASGQVVDVAGKPVPKVAVNMHLARSNDDDEFNRLAVFTSVRRSALTDDEERFSYDPLPPGDYELRIEEHLSVPDPVDRDRTRYPVNEVFVSQKVALKADTAGEPVRVQAVPYVIFEAQYYNSKEENNGHAPSLWGKMDGNFWHARANPEEGHVVVKVPHGLEEAQLQLTTNEHSSLRYRLKKGEPLKAERQGIPLGTLNDDFEGVEIIRYVAPIVLVKAVDEGGQPIKPFKVAAAYPWGKQMYILEGETRSDLTFEKQPDGRQRSSQMLPDEEVTFTAMAEGYENASEKVTLPEGEQKELTITLKKKAPAAATADESEATTPPEAKKE